METRPSSDYGKWLVAGLLAALWGGLIYYLGAQWSVYPQYHYGWTVPLLCLYLLWERWQRRPDPDPGRGSKWPNYLAVAAVAAFLPVRLIQEANPVWRLASWLMAILAVCLTLCVVYWSGGRAWVRHFSFPICFFLISVPWPTSIEAFVINSLTELNAAITAEALNLSGIPALKAGNIIHISTGPIGIDEACSGIRSIQSTLMVSLFCGEFFALTVRKRAALVVAGVFLAMTGNLARTFALVNVASSLGGEGLNRWHDPAGYMVLAFCLAGLGGAAWWLGSKDAADLQTDNLGHSGNIVAILPKGRLWMICLWLVLSETATQIWFSLRENSPIESTQWSIDLPRDRQDFKELEISGTVRDQLRFDEAKTGSWNELDRTHWQLFYFRWNRARTLKERVKILFAKSHRPEICLAGAGKVMVGKPERVDFLIRGLNLPFLFYQFQDNGIPLHVYYCVWEPATKGQHLGNMRHDTVSRLEAVFTGNRSLEQRVLQIAIWGEGSKTINEERMKKWLTRYVSKDIQSGQRM